MIYTEMKMKNFQSLIISSMVFLDIELKGWMYPYHPGATREMRTLHPIGK